MFSSGCKQRKVHSVPDFEARITATSASLAETNGNFLQSVDYRYNIRGWLKSINNARLDDDVISNDDPDGYRGDFFGMELAYDSAAGMSNNLYYNGNISAIKWKGPGDGAGAAGQRSYKYNYDKSARLKTATFQRYGTSWDKEVNALNETQTYDHNGNILSLTRSKVQRGIEEDFELTATPVTIDNLAYTYLSTSANQLLKVEDSGLTEGFNNTVTQATEYVYNSNGSLAKDRNKGIDSITYNVLGNPEVITYSGSPAKTVTYTYDASGNKLRMVTYDGMTTKTTDYVGGFVYENSALSFFSSREGRVVKNGSNFEYQYAIADHQGNTRVVFSSQLPAPETATATLEDDTQATEDGDFLNYPTGGNRSSLELFDHTDFSGSVYNKSQLLNGGNNSQVGLAKSFKVYAGDVISAEVYAKYWNATSTTSNIDGFAAALVGAFGLSGATTGEALLAKNALENYGGVVAAAGGSGSESAPKAFITVLLFDEQHNFVDAAFEQISTAAEQVGASPKVAFDLLSAEVTVEESGYAYVYISNENPTQVDVYFDDMNVTHQQGRVIQYNEYYPFGLENQNTWTRENARGNNFLYNGGTESNRLTRLYDLDFRNYDPILGRMAQVDPMADKYGGLSTYNYSFNDPVYWNDPMGADPMTEGIGKDAQERIAMLALNGYMSSEWGDWIGFQGGYEMVQQRAYMRDLHQQKMREEEIKTRARNGDPQALAAIVGMYGGRLANTTDSDVIAGIRLTLLIGGTVDFNDKTLFLNIPITPASHGPAIACGEPNCTHGLGLNQYDIPVWGAAAHAGDAFVQGRYLDAAGWEVYGFLELIGVGAVYKALAAQATKIVAKTAARQISALTFENFGVKGFTDHAVKQAAARGFSNESILTIMNQGSRTLGVSEYGTSQALYSLGGNTVVVALEGRNAGNIVTVFSNLTGGTFIPF